MMPSLALFWLLLGPLLLAGCGTIEVPMKTQAIHVANEAKIPLHATLLVPESLSSFRFRGKPESLTGGVRTYEFPLGAELKVASRQAFSQVFQQVELVRDRPDGLATEI